MRRNNSSKIGRGLWAVLPLALLLFGCDAESPTAPPQVVVPPVTTNPPASSTFNITVTADPNEADIDDGGGIVSNVVVTARRADNGQPVAGGTTALLRTSLGTLTSDGGTGTSVPIVFDNTGTARATLNATSTVPTTIVLRAQIDQSFGTTNLFIFDEEELPLQITSISPISGPPSGGTPIVITGSGFEAPVRLTFEVQGQTLLLNNVRVNAAGTQITAVTPAIDLPAGANALASLRLENGFDETGAPTGTDTISSAFTYTRNGGGGFPTTMKIFSLSPTSGPNEGGTRVTILGEGFTPQVQVYFTNGALIEARIVSITSTRLEVITPSATGPNAGNANAQVTLRLRDTTSGAEAELDNAFQYGTGSTGALFISSISPNQDEYLGGTLVTLFGQGFEEPVAVSLGGFGQQIISVTGTEIVVRTVRVTLGCSAVGAPASVTNIETNEGTSGPQFTYLPITPNIIGVFPGTGSQNGGTPVTIEGSVRSLGRGFQAPLRVLINGVLANVTSIGPTEVNVITPPFTGTFQTAPCTIGDVTGTRSVPFSASVEVVNLDTGCEDTLAGAFTYTPTDISCHPPDAAP